MLDPELIARLEVVARDGAATQLGQALGKVLGERRLLLVEHDAQGPDRKPAHDAVERFE